jgi:hypothetical protein
VQQQKKRTCSSFFAFVATLILISARDIAKYLPNHCSFEEFAIVAGTMYNRNNMWCKYKKWEDNASPTIRVVRIVLLVLIVIGVGLLLTQDMWVPKLVEILL